MSSLVRAFIEWVHDAPPQALRTWSIIGLRAGIVIARVLPTVPVDLTIQGVVEVAMRCSRAGSPWSLRRKLPPREPTAS